MLSIGCFQCRIHHRYVLMTKGNKMNGPNVKQRAHVAGLSAWQKATKWKKERREV